MPTSEQSLSCDPCGGPPDGPCACAGRDVAHTIIIDPWDKLRCQVIERCSDLTHILIEGGGLSTRLWVPTCQLEGQKITVQAPQPRTYKRWEPGSEEPVIVPLDPPT